MTSRAALTVDTVSYVSASAGVAADLAAATGTGQGNDILADVQNVTGSAFNDTLTGNSLDNTIIGQAGDDVIDGAAGNDTETGGTGDDTFNQGAAANGNDIIDGGGGACFAARTLRSTATGSTTGTARATPS